MIETTSSGTSPPAKKKTPAASPAGAGLIGGAAGGNTAAIIKAVTSAIGAGAGAIGGETGAGAAAPPEAPAAPGPSTPAEPNIDWGELANSYFASWNLPPDVRARIEQIFRADYANIDVATQLALNYVRSTDWYAQTFPGIQLAEAKGLVSDEAGYRQLLNQQTQLYKQFLGRDITTDEFAANLSEGVTTTVVGQRLQGAVYAKTYGGDWNYALGAFGDASQGRLSDEQATTLGQEQAGLDTPMGQLLNKRLQQAQQRLQGVFKGGLATPSLSLAGGRLAGPQAGAPPDIAA